MKKHICLFTAHSPLGGGGSEILRSLIRNLPQFSFEWTYLATNKVVNYENGYLGKGFMGTHIVNDIWETWNMIADNYSTPIEKIVKQLLSVKCDAYWIVSHNEGLRVALELARQQTIRSVHLTVHDDWAGALSARSVRYKLFANLAKKMTILTLNKVSHFDVISQGMKQYYEQISGREGEVCHRYVSPKLISATNKRQVTQGEINIGHIGSVYNNQQFFRFVYLLKEYSVLKNLRPMVHMWGYRIKYENIPKDIRDIICLYASLPEEEVIFELRKTDFVYAMYPTANSMKVFSLTSLPTKLSTYVQCCRPIFGHSCYDSTLAEFLMTTNTGFVWSGKSFDSGISIIENLLRLDLNTDTWQKARDIYFGEKNLEVLNNYFS